MRFLHILPSIAFETGGTAASVLHLCRREARAGNEVVLYTTEWPKRNVMASSRIFSDLSEKNLTVTVFPVKTGGIFSKVPHSPALLKSLDLHMATFDVVMCHSLWNPLATFSMRLLRKKGGRYSLMPHGMLDPLVLMRNRWKKLTWATLWERSNVEAASLIVFNTEAEERKARLSGWRIRRTFVLPHLIELSSWKHLPPGSVFEDLFPQVRGAEVVLFVGRLNWVKNLDKLIDALAIVRQSRPSAMLVCVGPDSDGYRSELERHSNGLDLDGKVLFTGMLLGDQLKAAYARANVAVLVSQKENFGLVVAEALASGLPVVVSTGVDLCANWESNGPVRRVTPTPLEIAAAIIELLDRSDINGLPDRDALALAAEACGRSNHILRLDDTYWSTIPRSNHD